MSTLKKTVLATVLISGLASMPTMAYETGDLIARLGWAHMSPNDSSDSFSFIPGAKASVEDSNTLGISFSYMLSNNLGIGVLGVWPFSVDIKGDGILKGAGKVADTKALPPTVTLQYHFNTGSNFHPYLGAGVNYTHFWDEDTTGILKGTKLSLSDSWGLAGEAGLDYTFDNDYLVSAQVWYVQVQTEAKSNVAGKADVTIDPWVFMLGVGKKF